MQAYKRANILYISYDGMTDPLGQSQVLPYLEGLAKKGFSIILLSFEKPERFRKYSAETASQLKAAGISWAPLSYTKNPPVISTLRDVWRMWRKALTLHREETFRTVHCRGYISSLVGLRLKRKYGVKFIFDMRGFYPDERVDGGLWKLNNPVYRAVYNYFKRKEIEFLTDADYSISLTRQGKEIIHNRKDISGQPIPVEVIPCCADLDLFSPKRVDSQFLSELRKKFGLTDNEFILSYLGSLGTWYLPDEMLDFFYSLLQQRSDARFLFITPDPAEDIIRKAVSWNIPANRIIVGQAKHHEVPTWLALSSASIFFIKPVFSKKASSPTKQGEIMALGLPQVCNSGVGDVDEITDDKCGVLVKHFDRESYESAARTLLSTRYDAAYIRGRAEKIYSLSQGIGQLEGIYQSLLNKE